MASRRRGRKSAFPDVTAHRRGTKNSLLVLESKKSTTRVDREIDHRKLLGYIRQFEYAHALFADVGTGSQASVDILDVGMSAVRLGLSPLMSEATQ